MNSDFVYKSAIYIGRTIISIIISEGSNYDEWISGISVTDSVHQICMPALNNKEALATLQYLYETKKIKFENEKCPGKFVYLKKILNSEWAPKS